MQQAWTINAVFVALVHTLAIYTLFYVPLTFKTLMLTVVLTHLASLGITMGYHRLWSHRSFSAGPIMRSVLSLMGTLGFQGSIKWWVLRHRLHHRFTETDEDPYSASKGFWFSHIGWIFQKPTYSKIKLIDAKDLTSDPIVVFQHRYYVPLAFSLCFVLPTMIAFTWKDALGGFLWAGIVSRVIVWHVTFFINSLTKHHEFPFDFRNGVEPLDYDLTKWWIYALSKVGLVHSLKRAPKDLIEEAKAVSKDPDSYVDPQPDIVFSRAEFEQALSSGCELAILEGWVIDLFDYNDHPGGSELIRKWTGKDITNAVTGGINIHSAAAMRLMRKKRIAFLRTKEE